MDVRDNFIFIDSENCNQIKSTFNGWAIVPSNLGAQKEILKRRDLFKEQYDGAYIAVQAFSDEVVICQDNTGSHGLYLYQKDGYFALSDSFLLLMENLSKSHHHMTLNKDYLDSFVLNGYTMESCISTPINEVKELTRNVSVRINKLNKKVSIYEIELKDRCVDISSKDAMQLIDEWHEKWSGIIRKLANDGVDICTDLSGGIDSRIVFMLMLTSGIDLNKININNNSKKGEVRTFKDDGEISNSIVRHYGLKLNTYKDLMKREYINKHDSLAWSFYIKMCFHRQLQLRCDRYKKTLYHFTGVGGEAIKNHNVSKKTDYIEQYRNKQSGMRVEYDFIPGFVEILNQSEKFISNSYSDYTPEEFGALLYKESGHRHHHGKELMESFGGNELRIGPLLDKSLHKIRYSVDYPYLLQALLLLRFKPDLLEFRLDSGHVIPEHTIREAKRINDLYPIEKNVSNNDEYQFVINEVSLTTSDQESSWSELWGWCKKAYESGFVKGNMGKLYPARVYEYAKVYYEEHDYYPLEAMWAAIAVAYCIHYTEMSRMDAGEDACRLLARSQSEYANDVADNIPRFPFLERNLSPHCRIILYGAGNRGKLFHKYILERGLGKIVLWVDKEPSGKGAEVTSLSALSRVMDYDVLFVTVANKNLQKEIVDALRKMDFPGYDENKILLE